MRVELRAVAGGLEHEARDVARWDLASRNPFRASRLMKPGDSQDASAVEIGADVATVRRGCSGEHPLFVRKAGETLAVGDRVADLIGKDKSPIDLRAAYQFIYLEYPGNGRTLFEGVGELLNGQTLKATGVKSTVEVATEDRFILPSDECQGEEAQLAGQLRERITSAHQKRVTASNGVLLSGGIDSQVMAITLTRDLALRGTFGATFSVAGAAEDESEDARRVAEQLGMEWVHVTVDPKREIDWESLITANNPYIGSIAMKALLEKLGPDAECTLFAGQDTRLHTPGLVARDRLLWSFYRVPGAGRVAALIGEGLSAVLGPGQSFVQRAAALFAHSSSFEEFLAQRHFHVRRVAFNGADESLALGVDDIVQELEGITPANKRAAYNRIVKANWRRQYLFDMGYMVENCESGGRQCALPFYDRELVEFAARLPFDLVTQATPGRAGHSSRRVRVNKYLLRKAYAADLDSHLIFRDKAVCKTNYLFFNGALRGVIDAFCNEREVAGSREGRTLHLPEIQELCRVKRGEWTLADNWLGNLAFNAIVVWSLLRRT